MRVSITQKIIIYSLILGLSATSILGIYTYIRIKNALLSRTFEQLVSVRNEKTKRIESFFAERVNDLQILLDFEDINLLTELIDSKDSNSKFKPEKELESIYSNHIGRYLQANDFYNKLIFYDTAQNILQFDVKRKGLIAGRLSSEDEVLFRDIWFQIQSKKEPLVFENRPNKKNELPTILIAEKIKGSSDREIMVMLEISMLPIDQIMFENKASNGLGETGEAYLVGKDLLMRSSSRFHENSIYNTVVNTEGVQLAFRDSVSEQKILDYRSIMVLSSFGVVNVGKVSWAILAEIDYEEAMVPIMEIRNNIFYLLIIIGLFLLGVIAVVSKMITAPIKRLRQATYKIADGKYGETLDLKINDEIGDLITAFNQMTMRLRFQSEKLEEQKVMSLQSLIDGQEIERQRLSRELHDGLAQLILAIKMRAERALNAEPLLSQQIIADIQELLSEALTEIRNISNDLMPAVLNEFGISKAVSHLVNEIAKMHTFSIRYNCGNNLNIKNKKVETYTYRIIQETLSNIIKHANAKSVQLCLNVQDERLVVNIQDDGGGFDVLNSLNSLGNGISNMKERVLLLGGEFKLTSKVGYGTKLYAKIPI